MRRLPDGVFEIQLDREVHKSDGTVCNVMRIPAGASIGKHVHPYSHLSALVSGKVQVSINGGALSTLEGFRVIEIEAYDSHVIHAVEDSVWMCIHSKPEMDNSDQLKLVVGG